MVVEVVVVCRAADSVLVAVTVEEENEKRCGGPVPHLVMQVDTKSLWRKREAGKIIRHEKRY